MSIRGKKDRTELMVLYENKRQICMVKVGVMPNAAAAFELMRTIGEEYSVGKTPLAKLYDRRAELLSGVVVKKRPAAVVKRPTCEETVYQPTCKKKVEEPTCEKELSQPTCEEVEATCKIKRRRVSSKRGEEKVEEYQPSDELKGEEAPVTPPPRASMAATEQSWFSDLAPPAGAFEGFA